MKGTDEKFPILAIETSSSACSAALLISEKDSTEITIRKKFVQSEKLLLIIDLLMQESGLKLKSISQIALSMGPGSFTGLRIGLAAVKGLAAGSNLPIVPAPTFDALALQISEYISCGQKFIIANSVNREELYFARYEKKESGYATIDEVAVIEKSSFEDSKGSGELIFGDFAAQENYMKISFPNATNVAKWAYIYGQDLLTNNFDYLEPYYHKKFIPKVKK